MTVLGQILRTAIHLRWEQVVGASLRRGTNTVVPGLVRAFEKFVPRTSARSWEPPSPAFVAHLQRESIRANAKLSSAADADPLHVDYELAYARALPALVARNGSFDATAHVAALRTSVPLHPFPAAVRARNMAIAVRLGARDLGVPIATAARAVLLQLEWHLLGNHFLENGIGLICAGLVTDGPEAGLWRKVGTAIVLRELREQFLSDGGHYERSATYHGWLMVAILETIEIFRARGLEPPALFNSVVERGLAWITRVRAPDDTWPLLNDSALDACPTPSAILELGAALGFATPTPPPDGIERLEPTGWIVARNHRAFVVADVGEIGASYMPGHAHADSLTFELWVGARRIVVDAGVAKYGPGADRAWTRRTDVHNTLTLDARNSSEVWGDFRVGRRAHAEAVVLNRDPRSLTWEATHDGYLHRAGRPVHRRRWCLEPERLVIVDHVEGQGQHEAMFSLRVDYDAYARGIARVTFDGRAPVGRRDRWFALHGVPRDAECLESTIRAALPIRHEIDIDWSANAAY